MTVERFDGLVEDMEKPGSNPSRRLRFGMAFPTESMTLGDEDSAAELFLEALRIAIKDGDPNGPSKPVIVGPNGEPL